MKCTHPGCNGLIIREYDVYHGVREHCFSCGREPKKEDPIVNNLDPEKEEQVKALLKTHSIREIVKETGVAKNTIARIRNENLTEEERMEFKKLANVKGRNRRELEKKEGLEFQEPQGEKPKTKICTKCKKEKSLSEFPKNRRMPGGLHPQCKECKNAYFRKWEKVVPERIVQVKPEKVNECPFCHDHEICIEKTGPQEFWALCGNPQCRCSGPTGKTEEEAIIKWNDGTRLTALPQKIEFPEKLELRNNGIKQFVNFRIPENLTFVDITHKYVDYLVTHQDDLMKEIKKLIKELGQTSTHLSLLEDFLKVDKQGQKLSEDESYRQYIEMESELMETEVKTD